MSSRIPRPVEPCPECGLLNTRWDGSFECFCGATWATRFTVAASSR